ncbi:MAG: hypothetical protein JSS31_14745 [Proteobacteria bacterium]|nr:hypothetical protein [Pseudomonadota bacterium]MBS0495170.1 hypothetical protein [Pseudomonadota bacterium]
MRDTPTYADAVQRGVVGDDPLGLAPTNERLYNSAFPGFNNYVRHIRVYSTICWMTQQVGLALEKGAAATDNDARRLFASALEKMELALVWANPGAQGLAGNQRIFPSHDKPIELKFETFGTSQATLFDAPTYKPSLTNGLRFLEARSAGTYACLPRGEALAEAFEEVARKLPGYGWLRVPDRTTGRRRQVMELAPALDVTKPSAAEQAAFLASFFPLDLDSTATNDDHARCLTLQLMLRSVEAVCCAKRTAAGGAAVASVEEIRACMARGISTDGASVVAVDFQRVQAWWAVLQVRQLQRLALESLYCVVEGWIANRESDGGRHTLSDCVSQLSRAGHAYISDDLCETVGQMAEFFRTLRVDRDSLYETAALWRADGADDENEADVFLHIGRLQDRSALEFDEDGGCDAVANAYIGLVFCAAETANLARNPDALQALRADGDACSMLHLAELVRRLAAMSVEDFIGHVIKEWVVLRHFAVVGSRSVPFDGKNRFRFVMGDYGLERFDRSARLPIPGISADKLDHALMLCEQAGLLAKANGDYRLTSAGRRRL